jgi:butyryl-CoA dehydrogenase
VNPSLTFGYGKYVEPGSKTERMLRTAREFRSRFIDPVAHDIDRKMLHDPHYHAHDLMVRGCEYGLMSLPIPSFLGGSDAQITDCAVVLEELCAGCAGLANLFGAHYLGLSCVLMGFSFHQFDTVIHEMVEKEKQGIPVIFAAAVTEPMAGTDVEDEDFLRTAKLMCFAKKVKGGYVINGTKVFISNGSVADYTTVTCATDSRYPVQTWSTFLVPKGAKGFSADKVELKMGMRAAHAAQLVFEDCFVPDSAEMGVAGSSPYLTEVVLAASRAPVAAIATGIARGAYERTLDYCRNRKDGNGRLLDRQWVQMALSDMFGMLQTARNTYLQAGYMFDHEVMEPLMGVRAVQDPMLKLFAPMRRTPAALKATASHAFRKSVYEFIRHKIRDQVKDNALALSSMAKFSCSDLAVKVCLKALEILGPAGAEERNFVEKSLRDVKLAQIYEGTNQLNRHVLYKKHIRGGIRD